VFVLCASASIRNSMPQTACRPLPPVPLVVWRLRELSRSRKKGRHSRESGNPLWSCASRPSSTQSNMDSRFRGN